MWGHLVCTLVAFMPPCGEDTARPFAWVNQWGLARVYGHPASGWEGRCLGEWWVGVLGPGARWVGPGGGLPGDRAAGLVQVPPRGGEWTRGWEEG